MSDYKTFQNYSIIDGLARLSFEIGTIVDDVVTVTSENHIDCFTQGQQSELESFCTTHNITDTYDEIYAIWNPQ